MVLPFFKKTGAGAGTLPHSNKMLFKLVWNLVKEDDRILLILPNVDNYNDKYVLANFRESINAVYKSKPKYVVVYLPNTTVLSDKVIHLYETVYNIEIQWLTELSLLNNADFMQHHKPSLLYILKKEALHIDYTKYFDKAITDTLTTNLKHTLNIPINYGISAFEEILNVQIYLNKLLSKICQPLDALRYHRTDLTFIIGKTSIPIEVLTEMIMDVLEINMCALVFNCNNELAPALEYIERIITNDIPFVYYEEPTICIDVYSDLVNRLKKLSATHIFIGDFRFSDEDVRSKWLEYTSKLEDTSVFDIDAFTSLLGEHHIDEKQVKVFRLSKELPEMVNMFVNKNTDPFGIMNNDIVVPPPESEDEGDSERDLSES